MNDPEASRQSNLTLAAQGSLALDKATFDGFQPGTGHATLAMGALAQFDAPGLLLELDRYPYGCTEQTTSRALPLLYLSEVSDALGMTAARDLDDRIRDAADSRLERRAGRDECRHVFGDRFLDGPRRLVRELRGERLPLDPDVDVFERDLVGVVRRQAEGPREMRTRLDDEQSLAAEYGIRSIPTLLLFNNGTVAEEMVGAKSKQVLAESFQKVTA